MYLEFPINFVYKKMDNKIKIEDLTNLKQSDFSIDHILNRAGAGISNSPEKYIQCPSFYNKNLNKFNSPSLDWLHYTRYHPPKLPSKFFCYYFIFLIFSSCF